MNEKVFISLSKDDLQSLIIDCMLNTLKLYKPKQNPPEPMKLGVPSLQEYMEAKTGKRPAVQTIYGWVCARTIPFKKRPGSKELIFDREEINEWLDNGKRC